MRWGRLVGFGVVLAAALLGYWLPELVSDDSGALECLTPGASRASLLAVGDVGRPAGYTGLFDTQLSVASGLDFAHRDGGVDALLLLGDNFYPQGLARDDLSERIRQNLVRPYCRFVDLTGSRAAAVASACALSPELRRPVPILAVLGNHDVMLPGSADLERNEVSAFVSNWRMSQDGADVSEVVPGLSVIHFDSVALHDGASIAPLVDALRASRGPWRVLAAHHPILEAGVAQEDAYRDLLLRALDEAEVQAHALLSGHEHNLQLGVTGLPNLPLQAIAGSGSGARPARSQILGREFLLVSPGYVRVDLERDGDRENLVVSLTSVADYPFQFWRPPRTETCWRVGLDGRVEQTGSLSSSAEPAAFQ
jgi:hypothetical protein